jgi:hypothetical protein
MQEKTHQNADYGDVPEDVQKYRSKKHPLKLKSSKEC